jgi:signal transduction histidine kinase
VGAAAWTLRTSSHPAPHVVGGSVALGLFPALMVAFSALPGGVVFAGFFLLTSAVHGQFFRVSRTYPYYALALVAQAAVSMALEHDAHHLAVWGFTLPAGLIAATTLGSRALRTDERRRELDRTRSALSAQLLEVESQERKRLEDSLHHLLGVQHDLKSPLTAAMLECEALQELLRRRTAPDPEVLEHARYIGEALRGLRTLFESARAQNKKVNAPEPYRLGAVLGPIIERARARFPSVTVVVDLDEQVRVAVVGGQTTLERVLDNVVVNACEGDGKSAASLVEVSAAACGETVVITVRDDGPGFAPGILEGPLEGFRTTKREGTGLGLFTVDRLVRACRGTLQRANAPDGGALVTIELPAG